MRQHELRGGVAWRVSKSCKMSVIIPCFNHGEFLPEAVESVSKIKGDDIELTVVDVFLRSQLPLC